MAEPAPFDSTRKALVFALNAGSNISMPAPFMSKAMAEGIRKKRKPKKKSYGPEIDALLAADDPLEAERQQYEELVRQAFRQGVLRLNAQERAAQAGFILQEFRKLDAAHQMVLSGLLIRSHQPCSCRRPCCSGWEETRAWSAAVAQTCTYLKGSEDAAKAPGKRGFSTAPILRKMAVEAFYSKRELKLTDLADHADISLVTAAKHRGWIVEILELLEQAAWVQADALLDRMGITGSFDEEK